MTIRLRERRFIRWCNVGMDQAVDVAVFDADNHLCETEDSLTGHLPAAHRNLIRFVELGGRKELFVRDRPTEFIPNPTFEVVARPATIDCASSWPPKITPWPTPRWAPGRCPVRSARAGGPRRAPRW